MHALTETEQIMNTALGLRDYCLVRIAEGKALEAVIYFVAELGREVTPISWASLQADPDGMTKAFFRVLDERDPDLVAHFTVQKWLTVSAAVGAEGLLEGANFQVLVMSVLGKAGSMLHITSLEDIPGVVGYGEVFTGAMRFSEFPEAMNYHG